MGWGLGFQAVSSGLTAWEQYFIAKVYRYVGLSATDSSQCEKSWELAAALWRLLQRLLHPEFPWQPLLINIQRSLSASF